MKTQPTCHKPANTELPICEWCGLPCKTVIHGDPGETFCSAACGHAYAIEARDEDEE